MPSLAQAFQELGYSLQAADIHVGEPQPFEGIKVVSGGVPLMAVNIEV
jgi:hypothetical protein